MNSLKTMSTLIAILSGTLGTPIANAVLMQGTFTGLSTNVEDQWGIFSGLGVGSAVYGSFEYETTSLPPSSCSGPWGCYTATSLYPTSTPLIARISINYGQTFNFDGVHYGSQIRIGNYIVTQAATGQPAGYDFNEFGVNAAYLDSMEQKIAAVRIITTEPIFNSADPSQFFELNEGQILHNYNPFVAPGPLSYFSEGSMFIDDRGSNASWMGFDITFLSIRRASPS